MGRRGKRSEACALCGWLKHYAIHTNVFYEPGLAGKPIPPASQQEADDDARMRFHQFQPVEVTDG